MAPQLEREVATLGLVPVVERSIEATHAFLHKLAVWKKDLLEGNLSVHLRLPEVLRRLATEPEYASMLQTALYNMRRLGVLVRRDQASYDCKSGSAHDSW